MTKKEEKVIRIIRGENGKIYCKKVIEKREILVRNVQ